MKTDWITVKDLKEFLSKFADTDLVVLSNDEEGNGFSPMGGYSENTFESDQIYIRKLTKELEENGYTEEDVNPEGLNCITLWPTR